MRKCLRLSIFLQALLLSGCAKPDSITTVDSPKQGLSYTVETYNAGGPTSDTTRVYARLEDGKKTKKILVLEGENLTVAKIVWSGPSDVTICIDGGITETFRNEVTLILGNESQTVTNHLREKCAANS